MWNKNGSVHLVLSNGFTVSIASPNGERFAGVEHFALHVLLYFGNSYVAFPKAWIRSIEVDV